MRGGAGGHGRGSHAGRPGRVVSLNPAVAGVSRGLPRALPAVWQGPERGPLRLRAGRGGPALAGAGRAQGQVPRLTRQESPHGRTQEKDIEAEEAGPSHALQGRTSHATAVPPLRGHEAAAPAVPDLWLLQARAAGRRPHPLTSSPSRPIPCAATTPP